MRYKAKNIQSAVVAIASAATCIVLASTSAAIPASAASGGQEKFCSHAGSTPALATDSTTVRTAVGLSPPPTIPAAAWVIADADTGAVLAEKNMRTRLKPASTFKVLTLLTLLSSGKPLDGVYTATADDDAVEGSSAELAAGGVYTVEDLVHGLVLVSGNDAAHAIANYGGGQAVFAQQMNRQASFVNASDTSAVNPSGLDDPGQCTTVRDMAQFFRAGLKNRKFKEIFSQKEYLLPSGGRNVDGKADETYLIVSQNRLLMHDYPGILGGKTGFTDEAGRTFVAAAERDGRTLILAMFGFSSDTEETATALFDWGFANRTPTANGETLPSLYWSPLLKLF